MLLELRLQVLTGTTIFTSTGVSTIIRDELLSAVCEISMTTSQSTAFTLVFCKNALEI